MPVSAFSASLVSSAALKAALPDSIVTAGFAVNGRQVYSERTEAELKAFLNGLQF